MSNLPALRHFKRVPTQSEGRVRDSAGYRSIFEQADLNTSQFSRIVAPAANNRTEVALEMFVDGGSHGAGVAPRLRLHVG